MTVAYEGHGVTVHIADALDVLAGIADASVDAVVTDPPYGLEFMGKGWDAPWQEADVNADAGFHGGGISQTAGLPSFTGSSNPKCLNCKGTRRGRRDGTAKVAVCLCVDGGRFPNTRAVEMRAFGEWCEAWATECLRVLKPGGHLLAFGGTRTWHRLACAVEDAGFEVRDSIAWMYGSGFPKSLDVSKAIDKRRDWTALPLLQAKVREARKGLGISQSEAARRVGLIGPDESLGGGGFMWFETGMRVPTREQYPRLKAALGLDDECDRAFEEAEREVTGMHHQGNAIGNYELKHGVGKGRTANERRDAPATPDAERWQGWGTALKPAHEPVVCARKPFVGTVAQTVLAHGTGALNIDGCRIGDGDDRTNGGPTGARIDAGEGYGGGWSDAESGRARPSGGRWPANVILDESQAAALDEQSGETVSKSGGASGTHFSAGEPGVPTPDRPRGGHDDTGGASRFFYVAKAPKGERPVAFRPSCNCETMKPWTGQSQPRDTAGSESAGDRSWNTSTSGSSTTDATSPRGTTSTTETATSSTTTSGTSNSSRSSSTSESTPVANSETASGGSPAPSAANSSPSTSSTGTSARKAGPSTADAGHATSGEWSETSACGRCGAPAKREAHPTVKPLSLMRWLVRLVTPPGGTVLEPFAGSGTTVEACIVEGFDCIAIEKGEEYLPLIMQRINRQRDPVEAIRQRGEDLGLFDLEGTP